MSDQKLEHEAAAISYILRNADRPAECVKLMDEAAQVIDDLRAENERVRRSAIIWENFQPEIASLIDFGRSERSVKILGLRVGDSIFKGIDNFLRSLPVPDSTTPQ